MKAPQFLTAALAALVLAGSASRASADTGTVVHICGSSAFRANTYNSILNLLVASKASFTYGYTGSTLGKATYAEFQGTVAGNVVTIKTHFTGSASGVQAVANNIAQSFYGPAGVTIAGNAASLTSGGTSGLDSPGQTTGTKTAPLESVVPEVALSDVYQATTPFNSNALTQQSVGVVPFVWVASNGSHGITNMTPQLAQYLYTSGFIPLSQFSGLNTDERNLVVAGGRDPDSGTRLTAMAETGIGVTATINQYAPSSSASPVAGYTLYPAETVNGIAVSAGNGGEASGGTLAGFVRQTGTDGQRFDGAGNPLTGYLVTYLGTNDAGGTALAASGSGSGPGVQLNYNGFGISLAAPNADGVVFLTNNAPITEGQYTFWSYEHLDYGTGYSGVGKTTADAIASDMAANTAVIPLTAMHVTRTGDGLSVTSAFF